jgi:hypothetical protein
MQTATTETTATPKRYQCRHIFTDGHRCGSPCLRREELCYYHHTTRRPAENPTERRARMSTFALPLPEDRSAIQHAIGEVLQRIAANAIDPKRAGLLLYGLQIASLNLPKAPETNRTTAPVEESVTDPHLGTLAPRTEVIPEETPLSPLAQIVAELQRGRPTQPEEPAPEPQPEPWLLPNLQACEDTRQPRRKTHEASESPAYIAFQAQKDLCRSWPKQQKAPRSRGSLLIQQQCSRG